MGWLRRRYGASPLHLLAMIACFALAGYAVTRIRDQGGLVRILLWFALALVIHDLVAWPLYAWADRAAGRRSDRLRDQPAQVPWINHVRVPAVISGVLLAISFPLVLRLSEVQYHNYTGLSESPYLGHWLLVTGVLFAVSAALYAFRLNRARRRSAAPRG